MIDRGDQKDMQQRLALVMEAAALDLWEIDLLTGRVTARASRIFHELGYSDSEIADRVEDVLRSYTRTTQRRSGRRSTSTPQG